MGQPVVQFEIGCRDRAKAGAFYSALFDWNIEEMATVAMIQTGAADGIQGHIISLGHEPHNYTIFYVRVNDLKASIDKSQSLGGRLIVGPVRIPQGTFAWIADPDGNTVGLLQDSE